jgi:hypothetical protein
MAAFHLRGLTVQTFDDRPHSVLAARFSFAIAVIVRGDGSDGDGAEEPSDDCAGNET